jgi:hypothetical protein
LCWFDVPDVLHQSAKPISQYILHATECATVYLLGAPVLHQEQAQDADARHVTVRGGK